MDWRTTIDRPAGPSRHRTRFRDACPGLMRTSGLAGFLLIGFSTLHVGTTWLGYDSEWWFDVVWDLKTVVLVACSLLAAILGGLVGASIGVSIRVADDVVCRRITLIWHYLANGSLAFSMLLMILIMRVVGGEAEVTKLVKGVGVTRMTLLMFSSSAGSSLAAGFLVTFLGFHPLNERVRVWRAIIATALPASAAAYLTFRYLGLDSELWVLIGVLYPIATVLVTAQFVLQDDIARDQARKDLL